MGVTRRRSADSTRPATTAMAATRRLHKELEDIKKSGTKSFRDIQVDEQNILTWHGFIVPDQSPYNKGAFRIKINFPAEYPFKPPKISFKTKIYHPNIDEKGQVCLPIISPENWKPATKTDQVIQALVALVNDPEPEHPLRADLAEEYTKDRKKFMKNAEEFTKKYSEKRTERLGWSVGDVTFSPSLPPSPTLNARNSTLLSYSILHQPAHPYRPSQQYQNLDSIWINKKIGAVRK